MKAGPTGLTQRYPDLPSCRRVAEEAHALMTELYPICRSITGNGLRRTLDRMARVAPFEAHEVPSGTRLFDWEVPDEWNVRAAWIRAPDGTTLADFEQHNLHLVGYSIPFRGHMSLEDLRPHLHSLPDRPDWIPYRTSYYARDWGFCLRHRDLEAMRPGRYEICVDTTLEPGSLTYAEAFIPGRSSREVLVYSHACHPSLANDNLTGLTLAALLCRELAGLQPRLSYRFVAGPGTLGSLAWLAANEARLDRIEHGLVLALLGDPGELTYKASRRGNAVIDRAAGQVLAGIAGSTKLVDFDPYGYDERQFCSPGFDLPVGRLTRSANGGYPEYHTSADDLELIDIDSLAESFLAIVRLVELLENNRRCLNRLPKGEPRLGTRGLYGSLGGISPGEFQHALLWVLNQSDGRNDLLAIAGRSGLDFGVIASAAAALEEAGLLRTAESSIVGSGGAS